MVNKDDYILALNCDVGAKASKMRARRFDFR